MDMGLVFFWTGPIGLGVFLAGLGLLPWASARRGRSSVPCTSDQARLSVGHVLQPGRRCICVGLPNARCLQDFTYLKESLS